MLRTFEKCFANFLTFENGNPVVVIVRNKRSTRNPCLYSTMKVFLKIDTDKSDTQVTFSCFQVLDHVFELRMSNLPKEIIPQSFPFLSL